VNSDGTLFSSSTPGATFDRVVNGIDPGYYGTWQLSGNGLFVNTVHFPYDARCDGRIGHYTSEFSTNCDHLTLRLVEDSCMERTALTASPLLRQ